MPAPDPLDRLPDLLSGLYHHGALPGALRNRAPDLVALLAPPRPGEAGLSQARRAHATLADAVDDVAASSPLAAQALRLLLWIDPPAGTDIARGAPALKHRRAQVARLYGLQPETWRKPRHEGQLTVTLAMAVADRLARTPAPDTRQTSQARHRGAPAVPTPRSRPAEPTQTPPDRGYGGPTFPLPDEGNPEHLPRPADSFRPRNPPPPAGAFRPRDPDPLLTPNWRDHPPRTARPERAGHGREPVDAP
jgi:hypothetical protein